jgi:phosphoheptose isomerase
VTAIANDLSYKESLSYNLKNYGTARDLLVLVSSSGTSPNILDAVRVANELKMNSILLSGFGKKTAPANVTVEVNVESDDYQVIEDIHTIYGHLVLKAFA